MLRVWLAVWKGHGSAPWAQEVPRMAGGGVEQVTVCWFQRLKSSCCYLLYSRRLLHHKRYVVLLPSL